MGRLSDIVKSLELATPKELGALLDNINRTAYQENDWSPISVKASYTELMATIDVEWGRVKELLDYGHETSDVHDCSTGEEYTLNNRQAMMNLKLAYDYLNNPPVVENPNSEGISVEDDAIDWSKPVFTEAEVRTMLNVSENTFRRWLKDGWISYTQMAGGDKKFIDKESLMAFLHNPRIFYPSSK